MDKCKFCGADAEMHYSTKCGTYGEYQCGSECYNSAWNISKECYERQIQQSEARARDLWEALELVEMTRYTDDFHWAEIMAKVGQQVNKHADHFGTGKRGDQ